MYQRIGHFRTVEEFGRYMSDLGITLPIDDKILSSAEGSPLARPLKVGDFEVGNRWCIHPMEGWDGTDDGRPSEATIRRWRNFGLSGAKLIWGGEAFAVRRDGRANPNQLYYRPENAEPVRQLLTTLRSAHAEAFGAGAVDSLLVGLQLTHSGRFCRPNRKDLHEPRIAYHHPVLDAKFNIKPDDSAVVWRDEEIRELTADYVRAAKLAQQCGFQFVDVKSCHGYLGHEFLSAFDRPGPYGGSFENRTRFIRDIISGIRAECPGLMVGVRLSLFDFPPFYPDPTKGGDGKLGPGIPHAHSTPYSGFGCDRSDPFKVDLAEPIELLQMLNRDYGVAMFNLTAGSPYYNPHMQRPAYFPPSDGYQPPEDPLIGCARQMNAVHQLKQALPNVPMIGTAFSYLQEYLPHVAQGVIRQGWMDSVGLGRMVLSYWDLPADTLGGKHFQAKRLCRTFSDCTTAPRGGIISGCYPLDHHYKDSPEAEDLKALKAKLRKSLTVAPKS